MSSILPPEVVKVVYDYPESPHSRIKYSLNTDSNISTPTRKRRRQKLNASPPRTRRPPDQRTSLPSGPLKPISEAIVNDGISVLDSATSADGPWDNSNPLWERLGIEEEFVVTTNHDEDPTVVEDRKFSFFVEAVCSDQCSFLQLTEDIFVANDWNMEKDEATVS